jgi:hypothetical protein
MGAKKPNPKPKYLQILMQSKDEKKKAEARSNFAMSQTTLQQEIIRREGQVAKQRVEAEEQLTSNPPDYNAFLNVDNQREVGEIEIDKLKKVMKEYFGVDYKSIEVNTDYDDED